MILLYVGSIRSPCTINEMLNDGTQQKKGITSTQIVQVTEGNR